MATLIILRYVLLLPALTCTGLSLQQPSLLRPSLCSANWPTFQSLHPLRESQVVEAPSPPKDFVNFSHGSTYEGLFIDTQSNFAFCTIEKNACSNWSKVLRNVRENTLTNSVARGIVHDSFDAAGPAAIARLFSDPLSVRAVVVRDPLARFASAFLDKCFSGDCANPYCYPRDSTDDRSRTAAPGEAISFGAAVRWMLANDPRVLDGHWKLQSEHCELRDRVHEYTHILRFDKATLNADASCIIDLADIDGHTTSDSPFGLEAATDPVEMSEEALLQKLFTPTAALQLIDHMRQDYDVFHLPFPSWISNATGEWHDVILQESCNTALVSIDAAGFIQESTDSASPPGDDVLDLAKTAGYLR